MISRMANHLLSRRSFVGLSAMLPWALTSHASTAPPVGLELYTLHETLKTCPCYPHFPSVLLDALAHAGYKCVEFYAPYFEWTEAEIKQIRKALDDRGMSCYSTHNDEKFLTPDNISRVQDLNSILGSRYVVQAHSEQKKTIDGWKAVADNLNVIAEKLKPARIWAGYHNHNAEFQVLNGQRPMDFLAKHTEPSVMLQLDVGTCLEAGADPVEWIKANPGRIRSIHCKDWSPEPGKGFSVLFGEGVADWKNIFQAAEHDGGLEFYLIEQEGSRYPELDTALKCLRNFQKAYPG